MKCLWRRQFVHHHRSSWQPALTFHPFSLPSLWKVSLIRNTTEHFIIGHPSNLTTSTLIINTTLICSSFCCTACMRTDFTHFSSSVPRPSLKCSLASSNLLISCSQSTYSQTYFGVFVKEKNLSTLWTLVDSISICVSGKPFFKESKRMPGSIASYTARSTTSIATTRSRTVAGSRKMKLKWWERRPILPNAWLIDLQKGSYLASIYSLVRTN